MTEFHKAIVDALLARHGTPFARELGVDIRRNTPAPLFRLLCLTLLTSAPVQADIAMRGAQALARAGWTTPRKLQQSTWRERVDVLNAAGYARVDEKTASQLATVNDRLLADYGGDLRRLRARVEADVSAAITALKSFQGIGTVGAQIFLREVQAAWPEFQPFADKAALAAAETLGLPTQTAALAELVAPARFPDLVAALVRTRLARDYDAVRCVAGGS